MVPQVAILIGGGLVGIFCAIAVYRVWEQGQQRQHQYRQEPLSRQRPAPRSVLLGPCGICGGDVYDENYQLPCNHHLHSTCAANIVRLSEGHLTINWADVCKNCRIDRAKKNASTRAPNNEGLTNRRTNRQLCADCREAFSDDDEAQELACKHQVHKSCWDKMYTSGFTTCSMCMDEM